MSLTVYIVTSSSLVMTHSREKIKVSTKKLIKRLLLTQDLRPI